MIAMSSEVAAAWAGAGVSIAGAVITAVIGVRTYRVANKSAEANQRAADVAERAQQYQERKDAAADPAVSWQIDRGKGRKYLLRNTGREDAHRVEVDAELAGDLCRDLPDGTTTIAAGKAHEMMFFPSGSVQSGVPHELRIRWDGSDGWRIVAMPQ